MRNTCILLFLLVSFLSFGQEAKLAQIDKKVIAINADVSLKKTEHDLSKLLGLSSDGNPTLKVWQKGKKIYKIVEEYGLQSGQIQTTMYLDNNVPIQIIEIEKNLETNSDKLKKVFSATIYVFDWENDDSKTIKSGKRVFSEGSCAIFEYEHMLELADKAIKK